MPPPALVLTGIVCVQIGAGLAGRLFSQVAPAAVTGLRLWPAAALMAAFGGRGLSRTLRGVVRDRAWRDAAVAVAFGVTLGIMNFSIYQSFARIPLGIAVTIEFLGPLAVAVVSSRRAIDLLWVGLAGAGVLLLARGGTGGTVLARGGTVLARGARVAASGGDRTALAGVAFALIAAATWAGYILLSRSTGRRFSGSSGLAIAMVVAAVVVTPAAAAAGSRALLTPGVLGTGIAIGLLSSVIPYGLELETLRRIPARVFGIWMSLEPAVAALVGLVMLGETLAAREWAAIGCVMIACAGAARSYDGSVLTRLTARGDARPPRPAVRYRARQWAGAVLEPSRAAIRRIALAGVLASAGIILTGAAVRLSQSGLGCPDWPACTSTSIVAAGATGDNLIHRWIEFGNRLVTVAIFVIAVLVCVAAWRFAAGASADGGSGGRRRADLVWLAAAQPAVIVLQAALGGIVVLTDLNPVWVSVHFLVSMALVAAAVALYVRCREGTGPARPLVRPELRLLAVAVTGVLTLMFAAGTVVTGTGPLAGAPLAGTRSVPRYHLPLTGVTQLHADIGWLLAGLVIALAVGLRLSGAPPGAVRLGWILLALIGLQGVIGYVQYFTGLPAGLVWVHVCGSVVIWITALRLLFSLRDRSAAVPAAGPVLSGNAPLR